MRVLLGGCALLVVPCVALVAPAEAALCAQAPREAAAKPGSEPGAEFERHLRAAREGPLPVRSQAAARLVALGDVAAQRLEERFAQDLAALSAQGQETVEVLARFDDPELRALCWRVLDEPDFPWRPAAMRSLAREPQQGEFDRFLSALEDPLAAVRAAAVLGVEAAVPDDGAPRAREIPTQMDPAAPRTRAVAALSQALADEDDRVRREAAFALDRLGIPWRLLWPLEDLARDDRWFELEVGRAARYDAARRFAAVFGDLAGYAPERSPDDSDNVEARSALLRRVQARAGDAHPMLRPPTLPAHARAPEALPPAVLGVEIRSCRRGELFVALGSDHVLRFGTGVPLELPIGEEHAAALVAALTRAYDAVGERRDHGRPGCDLEVYRLRAAPDARPAYLRLLKGPEPVPDLRPDALEPFLDALLAAVRDAAPRSDDPRAAGLAERLAEALAAVGGPVESVEIAPR